MEVDFSGKFLNPENTKTGELIEIIGEGELIEKNSTSDDSTYTVLQIPVRNSATGKEYIYQPSTTYGKKIVAKWGKDTKNWIGKKGTSVVYPGQTPTGKKDRVDLDPQ